MPDRYEAIPASRALAVIVVIWLALLVVVFAIWPAEGSTCAHVCGPVPGHVCDAKAVTTLRHPLPSGGHRDLPLCGPCAQAETAGPGVAS